MTGPMDTLGDRMRELQAAGWLEQISVDEAGLRCDGCGCWAAPEDVGVDSVDRFEGPSDPGDESILFALSMPCRHRGVLPAVYGKDTEPATADVLTRLLSSHRAE
ncbi:MAG: hypothetical protein AB7L17_11665 [Ilumatobacteraceae bacterium]